VERFDVPVLPWFPWWDESQVHDACGPVGQGPAGEFGPVIYAQDLRHAVGQGEAFEDIDDVFTSDGDIDGVVDDLVERRFAPSRLNELWVSDITEHPMREGKVYCCCVMDTCSRRIDRWSIDTVQGSQLVINALDTTISQRTVHLGGIVHADHGVQFTSWAFTEQVRAADLMPSLGSVGEAFENAMMESFWSSMQNELLNRKRWTTRIELSNAIIGYIEVFYNRNRRHPQLGCVSPTDYELTLTQETA